MDNSNEMQARLQSLNDKTFLHGRTHYRVCRTKFMQAEQRYCIFTDGVGGVKARSFILHGSGDFKAFLDTITVQDDEPPDKVVKVALPSPVVVKNIYTNERYKNLLA